MNYNMDRVNPSGLWEIKLELHAIILLNGPGSKSFYFYTRLRKKMTCSLNCKCKLAWYKRAICKCISWEWAIPSSVSARRWIQNCNQFSPLAWEGVGWVGWNVIIFSVCTLQDVKSVYFLLCLYFLSDALESIEWHWLVLSRRFIP